MGNTNLPHFPIDTVRLGEPLTDDEFRQGYEYTAAVEDQSRAAGDLATAAWMRDVADNAVVEHADPYNAYMATTFLEYYRAGGA